MSDSWTGASSLSWYTAGNWSENAVPVNSATGTQSVIISGHTVTISPTLATTQEIYIAQTLNTGGDTVTSLEETQIGGELITLSSNADLIIRGIAMGVFYGNTDTLTPDPTTVVTGTGFNARTTVTYYTMTGLHGALTTTPTADMHMQISVVGNDTLTVDTVNENFGFITIGNADTLTINNIETGGNAQSMHGLINYGEINIGSGGNLTITASAPTLSGTITTIANFYNAGWIVDNGGTLDITSSVLDGASTLAGSGSVDGFIELSGGANAILASTVSTSEQVDFIGTAANTLQITAGTLFSGTVNDFGSSDTIIVNGFTSTSNATITTVGGVTELITANGSVLTTITLTGSITSNITTGTNSSGQEYIITGGNTLASTTYASGTNTLTGSSGTLTNNGGPEVVTGPGTDLVITSSIAGTGSFFIDYGATLALEGGTGNDAGQTVTFGTHGSVTSPNTLLINNDSSGFGGNVTGFGANDAIVLGATVLPSLPAGDGVALSYNTGTDVLTVAETNSSGSVVSSTTITVAGTAALTAGSFVAEISTLGIEIEAASGLSGQSFTFAAGAGTTASFENPTSFGGTAPGDIIASGETVSIATGTASVSSGGVTDNGTITIASGAGFIDTGSLTGSGTLTVAGTATLTGNTTLGSITDTGTLILGGTDAAVISLATGAQATLASNFSDSSTITGPGTLTIASGVTATLAAGSSIGSIVDLGTLVVAGSLGGSINLDGNGAHTVVDFSGTSTGTTLTNLGTTDEIILGTTALAAPVAGTSGVYLSYNTGTGVLTVEDTNSTTGSIIGTADAITVSGTAAGAVSTTSFVALQSTSGEIIELASNLSGAGFTFATTGSFENPASYTGSVAPGDTLVSGETVTIAAGTASVSSVLLSDGGVVTVASGAAFLDSHTLTGTGSLVVGTGGAATLTGSTSLASVTDAGSLTLGGTVSGPVTINGQGAVTGALTDTGSLSGTGTFTVGSGTAATLTGGVGVTSLIDTGSLTVAGSVSSGLTGTGTLAVASGTAATLSGADSITTLADSGSLAITGSFTDSNAITGTGTLAVAAGGSASLTGNTTLASITDAGTLTLGGADAAAIAITGGASIASTFSDSSAITGTGSLTLGSAVTATLAAGSSIASVLDNGTLNLAGSFGGGINMEGNGAQTVADFNTANDTAALTNFGTTDDIILSPTALSLPAGDGVVLSYASGVLTVTETNASGVSIASDAVTVAGVTGLSTGSFIALENAKGINIELAPTAASSFTFATTGSFETPGDYTGGTAPGDVLTAQETVTIAAGTASVSSVLLSDGGVVTVASGAAFLDSHTLTGTGSLVIGTGGAATLTGSTSLASVTDAGSLTLGGTVSGPVTINGQGAVTGALTDTGSLSGTGTFTVGSGTAATLTGGVGVTSLIDTGSLTVAGSVSSGLTGTGTLAVASGTAATLSGADSITTLADSGSLAITGSFTDSNAITGTGTLAVAAGGSASLTGNTTLASITDAGTLTLGGADAAAIAITGGASIASTFSDSSAITGTGSLTLGSAVTATLAAGSSIASVLDNGTLNLAGSFGGGINMEGNGAQTVADFNTANDTAALTNFGTTDDIILSPTALSLPAGDGVVLSYASGVLTVTETNASGVSIASDAVTVAGVTGLSTGSFIALENAKGINIELAPTAASSFTFATTGSFETPGDYTGGTAPGDVLTAQETVTIAAGTASVSSVLLSDGGVVTVASGAAFLDSHTLTGTGSLVIGTGGAATLTGSTSLASVTDAGSLTLGGTVSGPVTINGQGAVTGALTDTGSLSGTGTFTVGSGTAATLTGGVGITSLIDTGSLTVAGSVSSGLTGTGTLAVASGTAATLSGADSITTLADSGSLAITGSFTDSNAITGTGTLAVAAGGSASLTGNTTLASITDAGTLTLGGADAAAIAITGGASIASTFSDSSAITGTGSLTLGSAVTATLAAGSSIASVLDNGTLNLAGSFGGGINMEGNGAQTVADFNTANDTAALTNFGTTDDIILSPTALSLPAGDGVVLSYASGVLTVTETNASGVSIASDAVTVAGVTGLSTGSFIALENAKGINIELAPTAASSFTFATTGSFETPGDYTGGTAPGDVLTAQETVTIAAGTASVSSVLLSDGGVVTVASGAAFLDSHTLTGTGSLVIGTGGAATLGGHVALGAILDYGTVDVTGTAPVGPINAEGNGANSVAEFNLAAAVPTVTNFGTGDKIVASGFNVPAGDGLELSYNAGTDLLTATETSSGGGVIGTGYVTITGVTGTTLSTGSFIELQSAAGTIIELAPTTTTTYNFSSTGTGSFENYADYTGGTAPGDYIPTDETVTIANGTASVTGGGITVDGSLTVDSGAGFIDAGSLIGTGTLTVASGGSASLTGGTTLGGIVDNGTLTLSGSFATPITLGAGAQVTLSGNFTDSDPISGSGTLTIDPGVTATLAAGSSFTAINDYGSLDVQGGITSPVNMEGNNAGTVVDFTGSTSSTPLINFGTTDDIILGGGVLPTPGTGDGLSLSYSGGVLTVTETNSSGGTIGTAAVTVSGVPGSTLSAGSFIALDTSLGIDIELAPTASTTYVFSASGTGSFENYTNYTDGTAPGDTLTGNMTVSVAAGTASVSTAGVTDDGLITVASGTGFIDAGSLSGTGALMVDGSATLTGATSLASITDAGSLTLSGADAVAIDITGGAEISGTFSDSAAITGTGSLTVDTGVTATLADGSSIASVLDNGTLNLAGGLGGSIDLEGNGANSVADFEGSDVTGGTLNTALTNLGFDDKIILGAEDFSLSSSSDVLTKSYTAGVLTVTDTTNHTTVALDVGLTGGDSASLIHVSDSSGELVVTLCFYPGTALATPAGEVNVEDIKAGDMLMTTNGAMPVRWIGESHIHTIFADPLRALPIRIRQGALGNGLPVRDLLLSPDHAIHVDGILIQASALVNGSTIIRDYDVPETFTYYHVELDSHELLLAEGVEAESFVDNVDRMHFHNWDDRTTPETPIVEMDLPRAKAARQVPTATRRRLGLEQAAVA